MNSKYIQKSEFSSFEVLRILGMKRECLRAWEKEGFVSPSVRASGQGTKGIYRSNDLFHIAVFKWLVGFGLRRSVAERFARDVVKSVDFSYAIERGESGFVWVGEDCLRVPYGMIAAEIERGQE